MSTRVRWGILSLLFFVSAVTYLDRLNISVAGKPMSESLGLTDLEFGAIFSAFVLGYALFQIPGGWFGDRFGYKKTLTFALLWWSAFTALTPWAGKGFLVSLLGLAPAICLVRFLIGVGEAAALPCSTALVGRWFPSWERGRATGIIFAGVGAGSTITPPLIAWLMVTFGWETSFYVCAFVGILLSGVFLFYAAEDPAHHPRVSREELNYIRETPSAQDRLQPAAGSGRSTSWKQLLGNANLWLLTLSYASVGYSIYIFFAWFFRYLTDARGFDEIEGSFFAMFPFLAVAIAAPLGGWLTDRLMPVLGRSRARRAVAMGGLLPGLPLLSLGTSADNSHLTVACLTLALGLTALSVNCYWATVIEISPDHSATLGAIMNTGTNLVGAAAPILTPVIKDQYGWPAAWTMAGLLSFAAGLLWLRVGSRSPRLTESQTDPV